MTYMTDDAIKRAPTPPSPAGSVLAVLLTAIFATTCILKIGGIVSWSWAAILAPLWLPWACMIVFAAFALLLAVRK